MIIIAKNSYKSKIYYFFSLSKGISHSVKSWSFKRSNIRTISIDDSSPLVPHLRVVFRCCGIFIVFCSLLFFCTIVKKYSNQTLNYWTSRRESYKIFLVKLYFYFLLNSNIFLFLASSIGFIYSKIKSAKGLASSKIVNKVLKGGIIEVNKYTNN